MVDEAEAVVVGVGDDGVDREVGDVALFLPSSLSLFTMPPSPSSWLKLGREPAFLSTNLINRVAEADVGRGGGGGGGGGGGTYQWVISRLSEGYQWVIRGLSEGYQWVFRRLSVVYQ